MLSDPASKLSVPLTVVRRMRSSVPPKAIKPVVLFIIPRFVGIVIPLITQVFPVAKLKTIEPFIMSGALLLNIGNPDVDAAHEDADAFTN